MKYKEDLCIRVKKALTESEISEEKINAIVEIVKEAIIGIRLPIFKNINFSEVVDGKNGPLRVVFNSKFDDVDYKIELIDDNDKFILKDDKNNIRFSFGKNIIILSMLYGEEYISFKGETQSECHSLDNISFRDVRIGISSYEYDASRDESEYWYDYLREIKAGRYFKGFNFSRYADKDGDLSIISLTSLEKCVLLMVEYDRYIRENYIDILEPTLRKTKK